MTRTTPRRLMTLHRSHMGFTLALTFTTLSLCPEPVSDPSPAQVVGAQLHLHPVARQYPDVVHPHLARDVRQHVVSVLQLDRSEEHTSELQSRQYLVCRLLLEKKKKT